MNEDINLDTIVVDLEDLRLRQDSENNSNDFLREQMTSYRRALYREYGDEEEPNIKGFLGQFYPENVTIDDRFNKRSKWNELWDEAGPRSKWYKHLSLNRAISDYKTRRNRKRESSGGYKSKKVTRKTLKRRRKTKI